MQEITLPSGTQNIKVVYHAKFGYVILHTQGITDSVGNEHLFTRIDRRQFPVIHKDYGLCLLNYDYPARCVHFFKWPSMEVVTIVEKPDDDRKAFYNLIWGASDIIPQRFRSSDRFASNHRWTVLSSSLAAKYLPAIVGPNKASEVLANKRAQRNCVIVVDRTTMSIRVVRMKSTVFDIAISDQTFMALTRKSATIFDLE